MGLEGQIVICRLQQFDCYRDRGESHGAEPPSSLNIVLGSNSEKRVSAKHCPRDVMPNVRLLCPDSEELIIAKSQSFTISNVFLKHCNGSTVVKVVPDCKDQRKRGVVTLQNLRFEHVAANETNRVIEANLASCSELRMENIYLHGVGCGTKACITLPPHSSLKKMDLWATTEALIVLCPNVLHERHLKDADSLDTIMGMLFIDQVFIRRWTCHPRENLYSVTEL